MNLWPLILLAQLASIGIGCLIMVICHPKSRRERVQAIWRLVICVAICAASLLLFFTNYK